MFKKDKEKQSRYVWYWKTVLWEENVEFCVKGLMFIEWRDAFTIFTYMKASKDLKRVYTVFAKVICKSLSRYYIENICK